MALMFFAVSLPSSEERFAMGTGTETREDMVGRKGRNRNTNNFSVLKNAIHFLFSFSKKKAFELTARSSGASSPCR